MIYQARLFLPEENNCLISVDPIIVAGQTMDMLMASDGREKMFLSCNLLLDKTGLLLKKIQAIISLLTSEIHSSISPPIRQML